MSTRPRVRRFRRTQIAAAILVTILVAAVALLQLPPVATWIARRLVTLVPLNEGYRLQVGRVSGGWFGGLTLEDVALLHGRRELARVDRLSARYSIGELRGSPRRVREIDVDGATATARREGNTWDLSNALRKSSDTTAGPGLHIDVIDIRGVSLVAAVTPDSQLRVRGLTATIRDLDMKSAATARIERLNLAVAGLESPWFAVSTRGDMSEDFYRFDPVRVQTERTTISGRVVMPRRLDDARTLRGLDLRLRGAPLALADLKPLVPFLANDGLVDLEAVASADGEVVTGRLDAGLGTGRLAVSASTPLEHGKPGGFRVHGAVRELDPSKISSTAPAGRIHGTLDANLRGALDTMSGTADLRLSGSRVGTTELSSLVVHSDVTRGRAVMRVRGVTNAAAVDLNGWVTPFDSVPAYRVYGSATRIPGTAATARTLTGAEADSVLDVGFDVAGSGYTPSTANVAGRIKLEAVSPSGERVALGHATLTLAAGRLIARPDLAVGGGRVTALASVRLGDTVTYRITEGAITGVDLGRLLGDTLAGPVDGRFSIVGSGTDPNKAVVAAELGLDTLRYGGKHVDSVLARMRLDRGKAEGNLRVVVGHGRIVAGFALLPFDSTAPVPVRDGRLSALDLGAVLGDSALQSDLNATFAATVMRTGDSAGTRLDLDLLPSMVNAAALDSGRLGLALGRRTVNGRLTLAGPDGNIGAQVNGTIAPAKTVLRTEGGVRVEHLDKWTGRKALTGRIEGEYALDVVADSTGLRSVAGTIGAIGGVGGVRIEAARAVLSPMDGAIKVDSLRLRSTVARLDGHGTVALRENAPAGLLRVAGRVGDLGPLASLTGDTISMDSGSVALELGGPAYRWKFNSHLDVYRLLFGDKLADRVTLSAGGTIDSTRLGGIQGEVRVTDAASGKISIPVVHAIARYDSVVALDAEAEVGDSVRLAAGLRGTVAGDTVRTVLRRLDLSEGGRRWALDRPVRLDLGSRVVVEKLSLSSGDRHITADGVFASHDSSDVALAIRGFDLGGLRSAGLVPINGQLDGDFRLVGRADDPMLSGRIGLAIVDSSRKVSGRVRSDLQWNRTGLYVNAEAAPAAGGTITIAGMLPYRFTLAPEDTAAAVGVERGSVDTLSLRIKADSFNLSLFGPLLPPESAKDLTGVLVADGRVGGRLEAPRASGTIALSGAGLTLPTLGVSYSEGTLSGRVEGDDLRIERLRLTTGKKEELTAEGVVHLRPLTDPGLDLTAQLSDFRISDSPTLRSTASGRLKLTGSVNSPSVTGGLNLGPTDVFVGAEAPAAKVEPVELTQDDLRKLARDFGPAVLSKTAESPGLMSRMRLDIELRVPRRVWIRRRKPPEADIELAGQMRLKQEPGGDMQFVGKVGPVPGRGSLDLSGRTFRLTGGEINLNGPVDSTRLDVTAEYQVPTQGGGEDEGVVITVAAKGRLDSLGLEFTSEPSMSQEDVLSYIVTGHPASDNALLEGGAGQGTSGKQIAFGQLSQAIARSAGRGLGFDVFQIKQEGTSGLNLTAGRYLSDRFFLNLKLPLGTQSNTDPGQNLGPGFELEYSARRWLRAGLRGGSLPPGFSLRGRYAY